MSALVKDFAKLALDRGLHPIPCNADKSPAINREKIKDRPPTPKEIERWGNPMVGLICGCEVSPVLAIDFDQAGLFFEAYKARIMTERPELWARLTIERSMNRGFHIWIRTKRPFMTQKLAHNVIETEGPGEYDGGGKPIDPDNRPKKTFKAFEYRGKWVIAPDAIETRGATSGMGAYCLCAPSPGYVLIQGKILSMPLIEDEEVDYLISLAREFETYFPEPKAPKLKSEARTADGNRPGDDFNARGEILPILEKHGWTFVKQIGDRIHLSRPGKTGCTSATLTDERVFYPFSSNSHPFEPNEACSPFSVFAMLEHDGDFAVAAKDLAAQGYGAPDGESDWNSDAGQRAGGSVTEWPDPAPLEYRPRVVPEFDAETLIPDALRGWITDESARMPCPVEFVATSAIVSIGSLAGTRCGIKPKQKDEWIELPNLWGGAIGVPSTKKTPSLNAGTSMLFRLAAEESERFEQAQKEFQDLLTVGEIEQTEIKKQLSRAVKARLDGAKDADEKAHIQAMKDVEGRLLESTPTKRRYYTTDSTGAKLGDLLVNNPLGLMVFRDELGGLLSKLDHPDNAEERAFYLEGFGGKGGYAIDRMERGELWVPNVCLSVLGGIQPDKLVGYMNRSFRQGGNDGLLQRFGMLVYPEPIKWKYVDRLPDKAARDRAWAVFQKLNDFDPVEWGATPSDDFCRFCRFGFDADAQKIFIEWMEWLQSEVLAKEENPNLEEHFTKYQKMVPALALIFHLVDCADSGQRGPVSAPSMVRAAAWSELLMEHARKSYGLLVDAGLYGAVMLSKKIMAGAMQSGFSARDVHVKGWSGLTEIETVKAAIDVLVNEGWLRSVTIHTGGRKKDAFEVNPKLMAVAA